MLNKNVAQSAWKKDLDDLERRIVDGISQNFSDVLNLIAGQFEAQNKLLAMKADKADMTRLENKLNSSLDMIDDLNLMVRKLKFRRD